MNYEHHINNELRRSHKQWNYEDHINNDYDDHKQWITKIT